MAEVDQLEPGGRRAWLRAAPAVGWSLSIAAAGLLALAAVLARAPGGVTPWDVLGDTGGFLLFAVVGSAIVARRSGNAVGWVMIGAGVCFVLDAASIAWVEASLAGWDLPAPVVAAWLASWVWSPAWGFAFAWLPALFPDGRPLNRRWRWILPVLVLGTLQFVPAMLLPELEYGDDEQVWGPNPIGLEGHGELLEGLVDGVAALYIPLWIAIIVMQVLRYRRADRIGRLQLRWFMFGITLVIGSIVLTVSPALEAVLDDLPFGVHVAIIPLSVGIAVTRYRLYDIDRIISRTVSYALLVALLAAVYLAGVLGLGAIARVLTGESGDLVVALSTLAVAAVFQPLRRRLRAVVDQRFNRAGYDAVGVVERFARELRDEVSLDAAVAGLRRVASQTVRPASASVVLVGDASRSP